MEIKEIRRKINTVRNIKELTGALETLSAMKMKKAQKFVLQSRPFAINVAELLRKLDPVLRENKIKFLRERKVKKSLVLVLTSNRGFCGSFNQNMLRFAEREIERIESPEIFPVGKKGIAFFKKKGSKIEFTFSNAGDYGELEDIKPISDLLIKSFLENKFQKIYIAWMDFVSTFYQTPKIVQILPLRKENLDVFLKRENEAEEHFPKDFLIEPSLSQLAREVIPQLVEYLIYHCVLENNASEHSARMMSMRSASENAEKRSLQLQLDYNKARQEQITSEVCEISSTKEVLE